MLPLLFIFFVKYKRSSSSSWCPRTSSVLLALSLKMDEILIHIIFLLFSYRASANPNTITVSQISSISTRGTQTQSDAYKWIVIALKCLEMDFIFGGNVFLENLFSFPQLRLATYSWSKMNNCINFFLYILTSPDFRKEFLQCVKVKHKDWIFAHFRTFCSESCVRWLSKLHEGKDSFSYVLVSIYIHARSHLFERLSPSFHWFVGQSVPLF